ncbi:MAG: hypothetical protein LBJ64_02145 [Deltaproteobacteria bacterium]|jgi:hypothetical protein|nr:hypothetical protein [Deltaproteobacteria bacterium]
MEFSTLLFLIIGVPLILVALGFFLLCLRWLRSKDQRASQAQLLEAAVQLNATLSVLEGRLTALEDILLPAGQKPMDKLQQFDQELANTPENP